MWRLGVVDAGLVSSNSVRGIMMLKPGDTAPNFALPDQSGNLVSLADYTNHSELVLYFYPPDFTPG